jgi:hypothetical protein
MKKEEKKVTTPDIPQETVEDTEIEQVEDVEATTQPTSEAHVDTEESGKEQVDTPSSDWETEKKRLSNKMSKIEKENNEYQARMKLLEALDSAAAEDPEFMKQANKKLFEKGLLDEATYKQLEGTAPQTSSNGTVSSPAVEWARQKMQEEVASKEKFFQDFEERHSDLTEGEPEDIKTSRIAIGAVAARLMRKGLSQEDAYESAYKSVMDTNQLIEDGKLQGIAQAQSASPVEGAASGGVAKSQGKVELTPAQREMAKRFGVTEEAYAKSLEE